MLPPTPIRETEFLRLETALERYGLSRDELEQAIQDQLIRVAYVDHDERVLSQKDVAELAASQIGRERFSHLEDQPISPSAAAKKYDLPISTIYFWIDQGHIRVLDNNPPGRIRKLLSEADVAWASLRVKVRGPRHGRALFAE